MFGLDQPEVWLPVASVPGYELSTHLRFRNAKSHHVIKQWISNQGYTKVAAQGRNFAIHRLVYEVAFNQIPGNLVVRHLNDDKENNWPWNLAIGTHQDNFEDAIRNGRIRHGERNAMTKIKETQAREILAKIAGGETNKAIGLALSVSAGIVYSIRKGHSWKHLQEPAGV